MHSKRSVGCPGSYSAHGLYPLSTHCRPWRESRRSLKEGAVEMSPRAKRAPDLLARFAIFAPWLMLMTLSSRGEERRPPASLMFGDLPVSGSLADARRAGFTACIPTNADMRCRREGVFFERQGPFSAAVDLMVVMEPVASII